MDEEYRRTIWKKYSKSSTDITMLGPLVRDWGLRLSNKYWRDTMAVSTWNPSMGRGVRSSFHFRPVEIRLREEQYDMQTHFPHKHPLWIE